MAMGWRVTFFGAGLLLGVVSTAALFGLDPTLKPAEQARRASAPAAAVPLAAMSQSDCSFAPVVGASSKADGSVTLQPTGPNASSMEAQDLLKAGKEAAAAGQARDAELSFLMACRAAKGSTDPNGLPLADAQYQLARHYADLAAVPNVQHRDELLKRAQALFGASFASYQQRYGAGSERTRFAQEGLASVQQSLGTQVAGGPAAAAAAAPAASEAVAPPESPVAAAPMVPAPAAASAMAAASAPQALPAPEALARSTGRKPPTKRKSEAAAEATARNEPLPYAEPPAESLPRPENRAESRREPYEPRTARAPRAGSPLVIAPEPQPPVERRAETRRPRNDDSADSSYGAPLPPPTGVVSGPPAAATGDANGGDPGQ